MKKTWIFACLMLSLPALADEQGGFKADKAPPPVKEQDSGYRGMEDARIMTVTQAKEMHDGASLSLRGNLIKKTGEDSYQFRDKGGTIDVIVPPAVFDGREVSPDNLLTISGSWDKKHNPPVMRVDRIVK